MNNRDATRRPRQDTAARQRPLRIDKDSEAVFAAAIRASVLSEDRDDERFAGHYMYMHHDAEGAAWFKHRETRAYVTMPPQANQAPKASHRKPVPGPGIGLWAAVALAGAFLAGALVDLDRSAPGIGTVRLEDLTAEFFAGAVRGGGSPEQSAEAARAWGAQLEAALERVAREHGVVLLPAQAVVAGAVDYTAEVETTMGFIAEAAALESGTAPEVTEPGWQP